MLLLVAFGCNRQPTAKFSPAEELNDLPQQHQEQIQTMLTNMFGTPANPTLRLPKDPEQADADSDEESADESANSTKAKSNFEDLLSVDELARLRHGAQVYSKRCSGCHGAAGDGNGQVAEYLDPKPRDYRKGIFKFTSTPYGIKPARHDLVRIIRRGAKGTSMPAFRWMSDQDMEAVIDFVIYVSVRGQTEETMAIIAEDFDADEPIDVYEFVDAANNARSSWQDAESQVVLPVSAEPANDMDSVLAGAEIFRSKGCVQCHGLDAKGQTEWLSKEFLASLESMPADQQIKINYDAWNHPAPAADITARLLHGGRRPIDIYRRIYTGINGTPMPAFGDAFAESPDTIWNLVHYVLHIIEGGDPKVGLSEEGSDSESNTELNKAA
ncbi:MAG: c-type cytochrome [Planctomycetales bacterium]|nr:c-type cytochrome [Planctomycetales bacterium]